MRLGRLEIDVWRTAEGKIQFLWWEYLHGCCGCRILTILGLGFTWLSDECKRPQDGS